MKKIVNVIGFIFAIIGAGFALTQLVYVIRLSMGDSESFIPFVFFFSIIGLILTFIGWRGWKRWASITSLILDLASISTSITAFVLAELAKTCC